MKPINFFFIALVSLTFVTIKNVHGQVSDELTHKAPTLQVGLSELNFSKGNLDAELIMQIVAEKQKEIGVKLVQNMFLSKVEDAGGAIYSFTDNIIRGILSERDLNVITKKLLENTVNITFTHAFAEHYLRTMDESSLATFNKLGAGYDSTIHNKPYTLSELKEGFQAITKRVPNGTSGESVTLNAKTTEFIALINDISSEVVRNNIILKDLGIMQVSYAQSYEFLNQFRKLQRESSSTFLVANEMFLDMAKQLDQYSHMIGLLFYMQDVRSYRFNLAPIALTDKYIKELNTNSSMKTIIDGLDEITLSLQNEMRDSKDSVKFNRIHQALTTLQQVQAYLNKTQRHFSENFILEPTSKDLQGLGVNSDIIYTLHAEILPKLNSISVWDNRINAHTKTLGRICDYILAFYMNDSSNYLNRKLKVNGEKFIAAISLTYKFNEAFTFSNSVKMLSDLEYPPDEPRLLKLN